MWSRENVFISYFPTSYIYRLSSELKNDKNKGITRVFWTKQKPHFTYLSNYKVGMKSEMVTFSAWTHGSIVFNMKEGQRKYWSKISRLSWQTVHCYIVSKKLFLDLNENTQIKTSTRLIKVSVRSYSARGRYNPRVNWAGTRLVWLLRQSYQLQSALAEIVSLVSLSLLPCCYVAGYCHYVRMFTLWTLQYDFLLLSLSSCCYVATHEMSLCWMFTLLHESRRVTNAQKYTFTLLLFYWCTWNLVGVYGTHYYLS